MNAYTDLMNRFLQYGKDHDGIESVLLIGSRARKERPGDAYADIDLIISVDNPDTYLKSDKWLKDIGDVKISFLDKTFLQEQRVLFDGGIDVDIVIRSNNDNESLTSNYDLLSILQRGYRILLDKSGVLTKTLFSLPEETPPALPDEQEFLNLVKDFWYHLVWTTKKLQRGELWAAKSCLDNYMKQKLLWIIECCMHIRKGLDYNTWYNGRFLDFWIDADIKEDLPGTFSTYSSADMLRAVTENMVLFRSLAKQVAHALHYTYPEEADKYATKLALSSIKQYQGNACQDRNGTVGGQNV